MEGPDILDAEQVASLLGINKNMVYRLVREGRLSSFSVGRKLRFSTRDIEAYIESSRNPTPTGSQPAAVAAAPAPPVASAASAFPLAGTDPILDTLASYLASFGVNASRLYRTSYQSLADLYSGTACAAGIMLWDAATDTCNIPYVKRLVPGAPCIVFTLAKIQLGFITPRTGSTQFSKWSDLLAPSVKLANREKGSGPRVLLDEHLVLLEADHLSIEGYSRELPSELSLANFVARGGADVGVASERAFHQVHGLGFVPIQQVDLALVVKKNPANARVIRFLRQLLSSSDFRGEFLEMPGYDASRMGRVIYEV